MDRVPGKPSASFMYQVLSGNVLVQLVRALLYFVAIVILIAGVVIVGMWIGERVEKAKRSKHVREFKSMASYNYRKTDNVIFQRYVDDGISYLRSASFVLSSDAKLNDSYARTARRPTHLFRARISEMDPEMFEQRMSPFHRSAAFFEQMINDGVITKAGKRLQVVGSMKETIDALYDHLTRKLKEQRKEERKGGGFGRSRSPSGKAKRESA